MWRSALIRYLLSALALGAAFAAAQNPSTAAKDPPTPPLEAKRGVPETMGSDRSSSAGVVTIDAIERSSGATATQGLLPATGLPPLPGGTVSLFGGMIQSVDHVRDRLVLQVFQGHRVPLLFDERTQVFRDGKAVSLDDVQAGQRAYVDSTLDGTDVFARSIRLELPATTGQSSGQVVEYRADSGELVLRDAITPTTVKMRLDSGVKINRGDQVTKSSELTAGTLVSVAFAPSSKEPVVSQITILASPGESYTFSGQVAAVDVTRGLLVLEDDTRHKSYDLYFDPTARQLGTQLKLGANVTAKTRFDGKQYCVDAVTLAPVSAR